MIAHRAVLLAAVLTLPLVPVSLCAQTTGAVSSATVYVPDTSHAGLPLPDGVVAWSSLLETADATNGQEFARFHFSFTNITAGVITILNVHPSCGCTTVQLPPMPWQIPAGGTGDMDAAVNLEGKYGTLFKQVTVTTDQGFKNLLLRINVAPPPPMPEMSADQRAAAMRAALVDRQAVFKGDCASCHVPKGTQNKYGQQLYEAVCAICHEAEHRATMVPDLHSLKVPTNQDFWRTWITAGKAGSLMPAFSTSQGGPLNDLQIASLAAYLNAVNPSKVPSPDR